MRLDKLFPKVGLKTKIIAVIVFAIILTTIASSGLFYAGTKAIIFDDLKKRGRTICENLSYTAKYSVLTEDTAVLNELAEGVMRVEDVVYVVIQDNQGKTLAEKTTVEMPYMSFLKKKALHTRKFEVYSTEDSFDNPVYNFFSPITAKKVSLAKIGGLEPELEEEPSPTLRGMVLVGLSLSNVLSRLRNVLCGIILLTLIMVGCGIILSLAFARIIMKPIGQMTNAAVSIASGDLSQMVDVKSQDKIGRFASQFNAMTSALKRREEQLNESYKQIRASKEQLELKVKERTTELSAANKKLEGKIEEHASAQKISEARIKELKCFYGLSKLVEQPQISLEQIFQETIHLIRNAYQHPDIICAGITFDGIQYKTDNFKKSELGQYTPIRVYGDEAGAIEVYYLGEKKTEGDEGPFLEEERDLLNAVAEHLSRIAERKQTGEKLQLFRNLIDRSNECIFAIEPQWGRFLDINDRACSTLGYTREELLGMTLKDIDESIYDSSWQEHIEELKLKADLVIEGRHRRKDGTVFPVETSLRRVTQEKKDYIIAIARDITERKRAEEHQAQLLKEVESANQELKDFAYVVSHDLKAPLRGIGTLAKWLSTDYADKLDEDGKEQIDLLLSRVDRMHNLIDGVLQYSRVGRIKEERIPVDLNELLPDIIDMVAPPENIEITIENELPVAECEETRIMQVFQNLLSNAIKYMDKPKGQVRIGCVEENGFWKFSIADNGPGIERKHFERIFQIFQTLSPRDEFESTGVGLTVVKKIIDIHKGKIWVESEVGNGSTFFFTLPRVKEVVAHCNISGFG